MIYIFKINNKSLVTAKIKIPSHAWEGNKQTNNAADNDIPSVSGAVMAGKARGK